MASFDIPLPSEVLEITKQSIKDRSDKRTSKLTDARNLAINEILSGCGAKIRHAAENGHHFAEIYSFEWVDDGDQELDSNNIRVIFGGVRIRDLLTKDRNNFFNDLNEKLNEGNTSELKYYAYDRSPKIQKTSKWSIFVSWNNNAQQTERKKTAIHRHMIDETNKYNTKKPSHNKLNQKSM